MTTSSPAAKGTWKTETAPLALVMLAAIAIRLYALQVTAIINPDGALYIQQARAVSQGNWQAALGTLAFLSNYSLLISLFHLVLPDWLTAARAVSLVFGTLALLPLHGMLRQFFPRQESLAATAVLAFLPTWVCNSIDIVRDPVGWFFALYGLYWLARGLQEQKNILLPLSCLAFLLAAWARIEFLVYPAASLLLPVISRRYRDKTLLWFFLPIITGVAIIILSPIGHKESLLNVSRLGEFIQTVKGVAQYTELRKTLLAVLRSLEPRDVLFGFTGEARRFIWLIALGTMANRLFEAMSYPFTLIALSGLGVFVRLENKRGLSLFFCLLTALAFALLYTRILQTWILEYRYMMLVILPGGALCFCAGIASLASHTGQRFGISRRTALILLAGLLILSTLPKNLQTRGEAEVALKEIGLFLDTDSPPGREITIASSSHTSLIVHFYANQHRPSFHSPGMRGYPAVLGASRHELTKSLREKKIDYLLWEENNRPEGWPLALEEKGLEEIGRWHNHQTGAIILYRVSAGKD